MLRCIVTISLCMACSGASASMPLSIASAKEWLSERPADNVEGIWLMPADEVYVLLSRADNRGTYSISVIDSRIGALTEGTVIGELSG